MNGSSNCCEIVKISSVVRTESEGTSHLSNRFRYWIQEHSCCFGWIGLNSISTNIVNGESACCRKNSLLGRVLFKFVSLKRWKTSRGLSKCFSAVREKIVQSFKYGIVLFHMRPSETFSIRDWKTEGLPVRPIGKTSHLKEPNGALNAVSFWLLVSESNW